MFIVCSSIAFASLLSGSAVPPSILQEQGALTYQEKQALGTILNEKTCSAIFIGTPTTNYQETVYISNVRTDLINALVGTVPNAQTRSDKEHLVDHPIKHWLFDKCFSSPSPAQQENPQLLFHLQNMKTYWENQGADDNKKGERGKALLSIRLEKQGSVINVVLCKDIPYPNNIDSYYFCRDNKIHRCGKAYFDAFHLSACTCNTADIFPGLASTVPDTKLCNAE
ncbi:hypothetical protein J4460_09005 [Candidatus Woesearchaeota archaeon]|nr:hypothetical protein [Candidatus Woesearchaeota archaeon]HIH37458.1 hypothetical protein [Candidatus Woesearchaeota archaeon]HIH49649.1 hypothetical protein [Candidatus Woesearchaeota archaeon]